MKKLFIKFGLFAVGCILLAEAEAAIASPRPAVNTMIGRAPVLLPGSTGLSGPTPIAQQQLGDQRCHNALPNMQTVSRCTQRYMACLRQESVCGEHFESCDNKARFNMRRVACHDRLLECPDEGINVLFGTRYQTVRSEHTIVRAICDGEERIVVRNFTPLLTTLDFQFMPNATEQNNMIAQAMMEGAQYVLANFVGACQSAMDGCIRRACQHTPHLCMNASQSPFRQEFAPIEVREGEVVTTVMQQGGAAGALGMTSFRIAPEMIRVYFDNMAVDRVAANRHIRETCRLDVGTLDACYRVANDGRSPSTGWAMDSLDVNEAFDAAMTLPMRNWGRLNEWFSQAVGNVAVACNAAAADCVRNVCGSGSIAACFGAASDRAGNITVGRLTDAVADRCRPLVSTDQNCRDLLGSADVDARTDDREIWNQVWGVVSGGQFRAENSMALGQRMTNELAGMFSQAAIRNTFLGCRAEAESCIRRECGDDFSRCYINDDTGVSASATAFNHGRATATATAAGGFDDVMARGLCLIPIKRSNICLTFFDIEFARANAGTDNYQWGGTWGGMSGALANMQWGGHTDTRSADAIMACSAHDNNEDNPRCAALEQHIFGELIADIASEARARITQRQNDAMQACIARRGPLGGNDLTFRWATRPRDNDLIFYPTFGIGSGFGDMTDERFDFTPRPQPATSNLWGAFCQVQVGIRVRDRDMANLQHNNAIARSVAYFAMGDAVTCGSWILPSVLVEISDNIREGATADLNWAQRNRGVVTALATLGAVAAGGTGGAFLGRHIGGNIDDRLHERETIRAGNANNAAYSACMRDGDTPSSNQCTRQLEELRRCREIVQANVNHVRAHSSGIAAERVIVNPNRACRFTGISGIEGANFSVNMAEIYNVTNDANAGNVVIISETDGIATCRASCDDVGIEHRPGCLRNCRLDVTDITANFAVTNGRALLSQLDQAADALNDAIMQTERVGNEVERRNFTTGMAIGGAVLGAAALGIPTGIMVNSALRTSTELAETKARDEAVQAWFDSVGNNIECIIGGERVGRFGDTIRVQ